MGTGSGPLLHVAAAASIALYEALIPARRQVDDRLAQRNASGQADEVEGVFAATAT
jgi:hypothetical protein